jgi:hypothetical protein
MFDSSTCELVEIAIQCSSFRLFFCSVCHNMCTLLVPTFWHCKCLHVQRYFDFTHISVCMCRYRVTMFARWKLRGMYATCMWLVQLLLMLSKQDPLFSYVPEFYVETLVCAQMLHVTGCFLTMIHLDILLPRDLIIHQAL